MSQTVDITFHSSGPWASPCLLCVGLKVWGRQENAAHLLSVGEESTRDLGGCMGWRLAALSSALLELSGLCEHLSLIAYTLQLPLRLFSPALVEWPRSASAGRVILL